MDLIDGLIETNDVDSIEEKINEFAHQWHVGSIRAGRIMEIDEMNDLLRKMEKTAFLASVIMAGQHVELKLNDIEKLFGKNDLCFKNKMMTLKHFIKF